MKHLFLIVGAILAIFLAVPARSSGFPASAAEEQLRIRIETGGVPARITVGGDRILAVSALPDFYHQRLYRLAWSRDGVPGRQAAELIETIREADAEGLEPAHYHLAAIEALLAEISSSQEDSSTAPELLADLDLLLSDSFLVLGSHFLSGRINPESIDPEWRARRRDGDMVRTLQSALESGRVRETLHALLPAQPEYGGLRQALARYRQIAAAGGWPRVPEGATLRPGDEGFRVAALRRRLATSGDLAEGAGKRFDGGLEEAVRRFQQRHGLATDGLVGPATLAALNVPLAERIAQIETNLERWRWLPQSLGRKHVVVNIADFRLCLVEAGEEVLEMRVVVGRPYRRTPVFSGLMTYLVVNPYWQVPPGIAAKDILPEVRKDPEFLRRQNFKVFRGWGAEEQEIDPEGVDWTRLEAGTFPLRFRQEPGPTNALGRIKFMFPNSYNVFLHDSPARELFARESRSFSSGCIRLEKPLELAEYLLRSDPRWKPEELQAALAAGSPQTLKLPEPVPVQLLYWTSWVDREGRVHFRRDIYGRDRILRQAMTQEPPGAM